MTSVHNLRDFVTERLTAAAREIVGVFEQTIVEYQAEIERQRRLLDVVLNPQLKLRRIAEFPQHQVCNEEEVPTEQQQQKLCEQERNSSFDQEPEQRQKTESSLIKRPYELLKAPVNLFRIDLPQHHIYKEKEVLTHQQICIQPPSLDQGEPDLQKKKGEQENQENQEVQEEQKLQEKKEELCRSQVTEQLVLKKETEIPPELESSSSDQFLPSRHQEGSQHEDRAEEPKPKKKYSRKTGDITSSVSGSRCEMEEEETLFKCDFCRKTFKTKFSLKEHLSVHKGGRVFRCSICWRVYDKLTAFETHMRTVHTAEKSYLCNICGDRFSKLGNFKIHMKIHRQEYVTFPKTPVGNIPELILT